MLGDKRYCYPLTVSDYASRYLLLCEAMESTKELGAFTAFERLFKERGLPQAIRSDNGLPFASPNGLFNLSRLAVWWLRLGITIERTSATSQVRRLHSCGCATGRWATPLLRTTRWRNPESIAPRAASSWTV